ncbi:nucleotidyltransferase family protein [Microbaculum marinum]|uniref:Nucleotidyltransferase family protein n=1 Tax=Microbaculum marinum TaxID=1764581 RepID=A0AAW9RSL2_9HYPH
MVLAAGLGTRMRPITETKPKPLVEVAGKPLIDHVLDRLAEARVGRAVVNVHYLADQIEAHLRDRAAPAITISDERDELLETGGGIARALPALGPDPFYLLNTDSLWIESARPLLDRLAEAWDDARMDALLVVAPVVASSGYSGDGDFMLGPDGRLSRRPERLMAPFVYTGSGILSPRLFAAAPEGRFSLNVLFDEAIEAERLFGLRLDGLWMHVGAPAAIAEAEMMISESAM